MTFKLEISFWLNIQDFIFGLVLSIFPIHHGISTLNYHTDIQLGNLNFMFVWSIVFRLDFWLNIQDYIFGLGMSILSIQGDFFKWPFLNPKNGQFLDPLPLYPKKMEKKLYFIVGLMLWSTLRWVSKPIIWYQKQRLRSKSILGCSSMYDLRCVSRQKRCEWTLLRPTFWTPP